MNKIYIENKKNFDRMLSEVVRKSMKKVLKEYEDIDVMPDETPYNDSDFDDEDSLLNRMVSQNREMGFDGYRMSNAAKPQEFGQDDAVSDDDFLNAVLGNEEENDYEVNDGNREGEDSLYSQAMDKIESKKGDVDFEEWFGELEDVDRNEAEKAFNSAMDEYKSEETPSVEDATEFSDRIMQNTVQNGEGSDDTSYDGVEITRDGNQYNMVAKLNNPQITIKGSNIEDVKRTYDNLWKDFSSMEDRARKMGQTNFHGALLWGDQYDEYVRSNGKHDENYPIIIDLDKIASRGKTVIGQEASEKSGDLSWLEPYKHWNGQYLMTNYQASRLSPSQKSQWEQLRQSEPKKYAEFDQYPSELKANRYKKDK